MKVYILNGEITSTVFLLCSQNSCCLLYIFLSWNVLLWKNLTPGKWCKQWHLVSSPSIECHPALRLTSVQVLSSFWFCVMAHTSWTAVWRSLYWETKQIIKKTLRRDSAENRRKFKVIYRESRRYCTSETRIGDYKMDYSEWKRRIKILSHVLKI